MTCEANVFEICPAGVEGDCGLLFVFFGVVQIELYLCDELFCLFGLFWFGFICEFVRI